MQSTHAWIFVLLAGAGAFVIALGGLLTLDLLDAAEPYLSGQHRRELRTSGPMSAPNLVDISDGTTTRIVEINNKGAEIRTIYSSDLTDEIADFHLFAIPQTSYQGIIYVQPIDTQSPDRLVVYPMNAETGKLSPAVLNIEGVSPRLSVDQTRIAVISGATNQVFAYDVVSGLLLASWTLGVNEQFNDTSPTLKRYDGDGARWISTDCFTHDILSSGSTEQRLFCLEGEGF